MNLLGGDERADWGFVCIERLPLFILAKQCEQLLGFLRAKGRNRLTNLALLVRKRQWNPDSMHVEVFELGLWVSINHMLSNDDIRTFDSSIKPRRPYGPPDMHIILSSYPYP